METTNSQTQNKLPLPPGNLGLPLIGETISFLRDPEFAEQRYQQYGPIFKTHLFGQPTIMMIGAEANRFLFSNENQNFTISWPDSTKTLLGPASLALQTGGTHQKRRKLLSQAFQPRALAGYTSKMEEITHNYLHKWQRMGTFKWYPELRNYTFDVACKLLIGTDAASDSHFGELFEEWCAGLFTIPINLPWTKFGRALRCRQQLLVKIEEIILQRQQQPHSDADALGLLLQAEDEDGNRLSLAELKDQVLLLLFAGHETLTSAIASFCLQLAQHPEVLAQALAEQQQLAIEESLTLEHLKQMQYLDQVLKEVLRTIPPVGGGFRRVIQSSEFNGYQIPEGWSVLYQIGKTHQDSSTYTEPESFDPQRFAPERVEDKQKPFGYVPFGGGVRECLGKEFAKLEMKLFAALLIREYHWELVPGQNLDLIMVPTPHPRDDLQVNFSTQRGAEGSAKVRGVLDLGGEVAM
ncbi:cytochrome P450 [Nodularia spumigena CS-584]|jgi:retinoid hydroxylase|uniref:cytochrome P450 n=1 Tax=Nodularia spumigena TaxID=70799 RepID=UPI0000EAA971|nr:cytochrome P450 [Nodularia spumigena]AHJ31571.1 cytochrome P450 [Nodularia spumigena CCY9414]EAW46908.1 cytochrome P450 [Nodularia spumigena CCY9414]MDB9382377.1 cytochrome P450 [Nodularia spumigena CS-584]